MFPLGMAVCLFGPVQRQDICIESLAESRTVCLRVWGLDLENRPLLCISVTLPSPICKCVSKLKAEAFKKKKEQYLKPLYCKTWEPCVPILRESVLLFSSAFVLAMLIIYG